MAAERRTRRTRRFDDDGWEPSSPPSLLGLAHDPDLARDPDRDRDDFHEPRWSTYRDATKGPEPVPSWVVTDPRAIDTDHGVMKTGKEIDVGVWRGSARNPEFGRCSGVDSEGSECPDGCRPGGFVASLEVDGRMSERRESGDVGQIDLVAGRGEVVEGCLGVDGLPEDDDVDHHSERAELAFLSGLLVLGEFAEAAVEDVAGEPVAALAAVQDALDVSSVRGVVAVVQDVEGLDDSSEFDERSGEA